MLDEGPVFSNTWRMQSPLYLEALREANLQERRGIETGEQIYFALAQLARYRMIHGDEDRELLRRAQVRLAKLGQAESREA